MENSDDEKVERRKKIMALRVLLLRSKLDAKKKELENLRKKDSEFRKREKEFEDAITEMNEETTEEDREVINEQVDSFQKEKETHEESKKSLEEEIEKIEDDIKTEESKTPEDLEKRSARKDDNKMKNRTKFYGMSIQERDAFFERDDIKTFIAEVRTCIREKRALSNVGLTIPEVALDLLKERVEETSKLLKRVNKRDVAGKSRQRIMGTIPEAIWTEMCGILNEMDLGFNDVEIDGYKVGGFFAVCNAILEDNDVNLLTEILNALGKAIGKALDKAIVYGTGTKMPLGIVTRLAQTTKPSGYSATSIEWENLSETHVLNGTGATGTNLFKEIVTRAGIANDDYSGNGITWIMNKKTHMDLVAQSMDKNMNAAIVAGMNNTMPVIGGEIVELSFIPDNNIVFGYLDMYLLAERSETKLGQSEHCRFIEDQTVFKGTARYDGTPVIPDAFVAITTSTDEPTTSVTFPGDKANAETEE